MINNNSIFSTTEFLEFSYRRSLLHEAMNAPNKEIEELTEPAEKNKKRTPNIIVLIIQKLMHRIKMLFSKTYKKKFIAAAKKIDLYEATKKTEREKKGSAPESEKSKMLATIGEKIDPRMQHAWSALLSDCGKYIKSWKCDAKNRYTLEFTKSLHIRIPAGRATFLFADRITGALNPAKKTMSFAGLSTRVSGVAGYPHIYWMAYNKAKDIFAIHGGYTSILSRTRYPKAATLIKSWGNHQLV